IDERTAVDDHRVSGEPAHSVRARPERDDVLASEPEARASELHMVRIATRRIDDEVPIVEITKVPRERNREAIAAGGRRSLSDVAEGVGLTRTTRDDDGHHGQHGQYRMSH